MPDSGPSRLVLVVLAMALVGAAAGPAAAADEPSLLLPSLPDYPDAPPANLLPPPLPDLRPTLDAPVDVERAIRDAVGVPEHPARAPADLAAPAAPPPPPPPPVVAAPPPPPAPPPGLAVDITAADAVARAGRSLPPGTPRTLRVVVMNTGPTPLPRTTLFVRLDNARAEPAGAWRAADGGRLRTEIAPLAPGARAAVELAVRSGEVRPATGVTARLAVEAQSEGRPPLAGETTWDVRDCPGMYRERLLAVRAGPLAEFRAAFQGLRRGDPALPQGLMFRLVPPPDRGVAGNPARLAAALAQARGGDPEIARDPLLFTAVRITGELDLYLSQRVFPGLCSGAGRVVEAYRQAFAPVDRRLALVQRTAAETRPIHTAVTPISASASGGADLAARARAAAIAAGVAAEELPAEASALAILARARAAIRPGNDLSADVLAALSAVEVEAWLAEGARGATAMSQQFTATLDAILAANREACTCAF